MNTQKLEKIHACHEAIEYVKTQKSAILAWENCPRGDWMLWLASCLGVDKRLLTLAKGRCAQTVLYLMKDQRSKDAVKAAIDYGEGNITDQELRAYADAAAYAAAAYAAYAAAAADAAAAYAAYAAADAAYAAADANAAADAAAYAAYAAAYAAYAAAYAAYAAADADAADADAADAAAYAAYAAAKKNNQLLTANICREILTKEVLSKYKKMK
jgi:hypothetical protein